MTFEWDEAKRRANVRKDALDFVDVPQVFEGLTLTVEDTRFEYDEARFVTLGLLKGLVVVIVDMGRGGKIRVISARKATRAKGGECPSNQVQRHSAPDPPLNQSVPND